MEAYTVNLGITDSMRDLMDEDTYSRTRGISANSTGSSNSLRSDATFTIVLNRREDSVSNFGLGSGFSISKIALRTTKVSEMQRLESAIRNAITKYEDRSCKYAVEFAGRRLLRFPAGTNRSAAMVRDETKCAQSLVIAPLSPVVITVGITCVCVCVCVRRSHKFNSHRYECPKRSFRISHQRYKKENEYKFDPCSCLKVSAVT